MTRSMGPRVFVCELCGHIYKKIAFLRKHKSKCNGRKREDRLCHICGRMYKNEKYWRNHMSSHERSNKDDELISSTSGENLNHP